MSAATGKVRIALIHALAESMAPARAAFADAWPEASCFDLLDTSLADDLVSRGSLDQAMFQRIDRLADHAAQSVGEGGMTAGILFTCSAFGPAIEAAREGKAIPILKPTEAVFQAALEIGTQIGIVVSFGPSAAALKEELLALAALGGRNVTVSVELADGALPALKRGDVNLHDRLVAEAVERLQNVETIILGQFSLHRAKGLAKAICDKPVLTTPEAAVKSLRKAIQKAQTMPG